MTIMQLFHVKQSRIIQYNVSVIRSLSTFSNKSGIISKYGEYVDYITVINKLILVYIYITKQFIMLSAYLLYFI